MRNLYSYIKTNAVDGHVHVFDHRGSIERLPFTKQCIGFADIDLSQPDKYTDMVSLYKKYIDMPGVIWMATGLDIDSIKAVYEAFPDKIHGFGELKLYDDMRKTDKNRKSTRFLRSVCKFSAEHGNLPVYVHFELNGPEDVIKFKSVAEAYPNVPLVLCHMGMNRFNHEFAYHAARELAILHTNIYLDLSWSGAKYLASNELSINQLPEGKCFWGSDYSPELMKLIDKQKAEDFNKDELNKEFFVINKYIDSDQVLMRLFRI